MRRLNVPIANRFWSLNSRPSSSLSFFSFFFFFLSLGVLQLHSYHDVIFIQQCPAIQWRSVLQESSALVNIIIIIIIFFFFFFCFVLATRTRVEALNATRALT